VTPFGLITAGRIAVGPGAALQALDALPAFGARVLVVTGADAARAAWLTEGLAARGCAVEALTVAGEPTVADAERGVARARAFAPDAVAGVGGGAALDLAKAVAALAREPGGPLDHLEIVGLGRPLTREPLPVVAIPTTAGTGAEVTRNAVLAAPEHRRKVSLRDARLLPRLALVDPELLIGLPARVALASGLDALTQVIEPYLSALANPLTDALCRDAIPRGLSALPRLLDDPADARARADMALVSLTGGIALTNAGLGAVHGLAGVIGGRTGAAHGAICGRLLPAALAANAAALAARAPRHRACARLDEVRGWIAAALGAPPAKAFAALAGWAEARGLPSLAALGVAPEDRAAIAGASAASSSMRGNPIPLTADELSALMAAA
jgi:alcohol dehydrogenase class IV